MQTGTTHHTYEAEEQAMPITFDCNELLKYPEECEARAEGVRDLEQVRAARENAVSALLSGRSALQYERLFQMLRRKM